jgi:hypothetical protein
MGQAKSHLRRVLLANISRNIRKLSDSELAGACSAIAGYVSGRAKSARSQIKNHQPKDC